MILRACGHCGGLHPQTIRRCPQYVKPSGRKGSTRKWRKLRERILARDGHACQVCGATDQLEIHHLDGDWRDNDPSNLETRCAPHNPRGGNTTNGTVRARVADPVWLA